MSEEALERYRAKRDFSATPEPAPEAPAEAEPAERPRFVVQEHHARRLHWDFRLEHDGVLVSWAVPKGVPADPSVNHLAVHTEDHPMSYIGFEGEIPKGNYGAGVVTIWDKGTYECLKWEPSEVMVVLHGERVMGRYVLFQTGADQWMIHRMDPPQDPTREPMPDRILPMRATPGELPSDDAAYGYEIAWDGLRTIAYGEGGRIRLQDADGEDATARFPELGRMGRAFGSREVILDGEIVALDADGQPDGGRLDRRLRGADSESAARRLAEDVPVTYMIYDLLYLDGRLLFDRRYADRRARLDELGLNGFHWQTPSHHVGDGGPLVALAGQRGLAGVVSKRLESAYRPGEQSPDWIEIRSR
ncbi:MAG: ATP-dependent DNA ligase [Actinomycetota bacterium]|nr:ATP-dependent DNA ligase [Actinomycetota bacterium]